MGALLATPRSRRTVLGFASFLFLSAPVVVALSLRNEYRRGSYPPDGDIIAIPLFQFVFLMAVTAPVTWGSVWFCTRRYPGRVPLLAWDASRPLRSAAWTLLAVAAAASFTAFMAGFLFMVVPPRGAWGGEVLNHPMFIAHVLLDLWFLSVLRSAIVAQPPRGAELRTARAAPAPAFPEQKV